MSVSTYPRAARRTAFDPSFRCLFGTLRVLNGSPLFAAAPIRAFLCALCVSCANPIRAGSVA